MNLLTRQPDASAALAGPMGGALLEGLEVDLLIVIKGKLHPIEIKLTATPTKQWPGWRMA